MISPWSELLSTCSIKNHNENNLTLNRVVEISAFKISGSYLVLDEDPEKTFKRGKKYHLLIAIIESLEFTDFKSKVYGRDLVFQASLVSLR